MSLSTAVSTAVATAVSVRLKSFAATATVLAASLALPFAAMGQQRIAPQWLSDSWRSANYPQSEWFTGFSQDGLKAGAGASAALQRVEKDARNKLSENISVHIKSGSVNETYRNMVSSGTQSKEVVEKNYGQIIQTSTNAEVAKTELYSYHDTENSRVYAFAAVKMSTLAAYYANMIESGLAEAERAFDLAAQSAALGRKKGAVENLSAAKKRVESIAYYGNLMMAVDPERGLERAQGERASSLLKKIAAAEVEAENIMPVFVTGTESILGAAVNIIVPELQALLNDNDCRIAETQKDAGYILRIDAKAQNSKFDGYFYHSESSVRVVLTNALTGKAEITTTISGPKEGGTDARGASEAAFKSVAPEIWKAVKGKLAAN